ncbi:MAG: PadR family transcriptional regulator [Candidatus Omnitrophica bacterium]|nr:PadR family transcriptional regulator [Candidatus Omnitrophota bacterium]
MIEHELLLLGLLKEGPKHGYDIKLKIKEILSLFLGVNLRSIYYPLRILEKKGLVKKHTAKQGRRPQRFIYELTDKGKKRFEELLNKSLLNFKRPEFCLNLSLYFLHYLKPEIARRRLRARSLLLQKLSHTLKTMLNSSKEKSSHLLSHILEHDLQMVETERQFLLHFLKGF